MSIAPFIDGARGARGRIFHDVAHQKRSAGLEDSIAFAANELRGGEVLFLHQGLERFKVMSQRSKARRFPSARSGVELENTVKFVRWTVWFHHRRVSVTGVVELLRKGVMA